ncbi:MAG: amidohydrolase family protein [Pseudomonadota bacterium]|nr:amidohydrolase family protein [Pseudomonadota bacterium]
MPPRATQPPFWRPCSGCWRAGAPGSSSRAPTCARPAAAPAMPTPCRWAAPERLVWGSDWPHTTEAPGTVDDAALLDLLAAWCGQDERLLHAILVDNPARLYGFPFR